MTFIVFIEKQNNSKMDLWSHVIDAFKVYSVSQLSHLLVPVRCAVLSTSCKIA